MFLKFTNVFKARRVRSKLGVASHLNHFQQCRIMMNRYTRKPNNITPRYNLFRFIRNNPRPTFNTTAVHPVQVLVYYFEFGGPEGGFAGEDLEGVGGTGGGD